MKKIKFLYPILIFSLVMLATSAMAQEEEKQEKARPARKTFESPVLIDNQTDVVNSAKTLEWNIQHRFGTVNNGAGDLAGLFAPSNIRLGFSYSVIDRVGVGFGLTKKDVTNPYIDVNLKVKILQQARSGGSPVNVTYFGNVVRDNRDESFFEKNVHRLSYFNQLIVSRRINKDFSLQASYMLSHFNTVDTLFTNYMSGLSIAARYKVSSQGAILLEYTQPLFQYTINDEIHGSLAKKVGPEPNFALSYEVATSSHVFQIFLTTYKSILPQYNLAYNTNKLKNTGILLGFNMTRLWNF